MALIAGPLPAEGTFVDTFADSSAGTGSSEVKDCVGG